MINRSKNEWKRWRVGEMIYVVRDGTHRTVGELVPVPTTPAETTLPENIKYWTNGVGVKLLA